MKIEKNEKKLATLFQGFQIKPLDNSHVIFLGKTLDCIENVGQLQSYYLFDA